MSAPIQIFKVVQKQQKKGKKYMKWKLLPLPSHQKELALKRYGVAFMGFKLIIISRDSLDEEVLQTN